MNEDIIKAILDDHRNVAMYKHALTTIHLKLIGKTIGATAHYEDETGIIRPIFKEINRLLSRNEELEKAILQYSNKK